MENVDIAVSIYCTAYNHEKYIRKCLEGFVMQKTNFNFEILVHDDASTDSTPQIIREFEEKYPDIMKPIYQTENQYSKRDGTIPRLQYARAKGKYIAFCEGDDYWTDPLKLQKQYDALEAHPEVDMCGHATDVFTDGKFLASNCLKSKLEILSFEEVILECETLASSCSLMYRANIMKCDYEFRKILSIDTTLMLLGSLRGGFLYLPDIMGVYNYLNPGSWSNKHKDPKLRVPFKKKLIHMFEVLDKETLNIYHSAITRKIDSIEFEVYYFYGPYKNLRQKRFRPFINEAPLKKKIKILIKILFPFCRAQYLKSEKREIYDEQ